MLPRVEGTYVSDRSAELASGAGEPGSTRSEWLLWGALRRRPPGWLAEVPTGRYRLDFFCPDAMLAVEVDGGSHYGRERAGYDERRDLWHLDEGIESLRVSAREVERDLPGVLSIIDGRVASRMDDLGAVTTPLPPRHGRLSLGRLVEVLQSAWERPGRREFLSRLIVLSLLVIACGALRWNWLSLRETYTDLTGWATQQLQHTLVKPPTAVNTTGPG